ncbi:cytochrome o ubiquinol oxidase subunit IV [Celerinatantimonas sp. YJH-8]|uniref:cytochrome o ubiquinol oxidase subunit IV n=1 Tax=Celerinatantimonas sp. YJH-8 TaxID=3228714 RepID=UPI0038C8AC38
MSHPQDQSADHGSVKSYLTGFVLAVILTVIPFYLVMNLSMSKVATLYTIFAFAVVQIVVHLKYFLHLNFATETGRLNTFSFLFSAIVIGLVVGLSLWIIYSANNLMMF